MQPRLITPVLAGRKPSTPGARNRSSCIQPSPLRYKMNSKFKRRAACAAVLAAFWLCAAVPEAPAQTGAGVGGTVYRDKNGFNLLAPKGWVLDPTAGEDQGLPCVLYPKGSSWAEAAAVMYAEIGSDDQGYETFANDAIAHMKQKRSGFKWQRIESGKTAHGDPYFINEYPACESYGQWERAAYIQLPKAVALIVFTARDEVSFRQNREKLTEAVKTVSPIEVILKQ